MIDTTALTELAPTLRLLNALRAGKPLDVAASAAGLTPHVAESVAGSPLSQVLLRRTG